ncbi:MAG TPA: MotA/TolQ/ExbB proton channel family protein [Solimonas sp.]|nr:MotA/TolQ/ExbB proton channel family protein [Solimonas sp.]
MKLKTLTLSFALSFGIIGLPAAAQQAAPAAAKTLDELLEQVRSADARDAKANADREARFAASRDQQAGLLREAEAEKTALENQAATLAKQFEDNDRLIGELTQARDIKAGNLGELFGVMRQTAGDFATVARNSMLTAQFPDRVKQIDRLAQTKTMPPMEDLNRFWFEMQREMTEGGKITRIQAKVTAPDGSLADKTVLRVGPFVAVSEGQFLEYTSGAGAFSTPPKQPPGKFGDIAEGFEEEGSGYHAMVVDPTRGVLLSLFSQRPDMIDRIVEGEAVNWLILAIGLIGTVIAVYQFGFLMMINTRVNRQLSNLTSLSADNPLGRVLQAFKGKGAPGTTEDAEVIELRVSEAVLKELPPLERGQSFLKLGVAAGPLLGLVGTVVGMIHTFQVITESGSGDPKLMAAGISMAMIATLLGLGIAIPLLFANSALQSRSKRITQILDEQSTGLLAELIEKRVHA